MKEIRIPHEEIMDSQTITQKNIRTFQEAGLDIHRDESEQEDDFDSKERILRIKTRKKIFFM